MGNLLEEIYRVVSEQAGFKGRMRLAVKTGISKIKAGQRKDSAELISKFKEAADEILGRDIDQFIKRS
jgi:hypothetical protein